MKTDEANLKIIALLVISIALVVFAKLVALFACEAVAIFNNFLCSMIFIAVFKNFCEIACGDSYDEFYSEDEE